MGQGQLLRARSRAVASVVALTALAAAVAASLTAPASTRAVPTEPERPNVVVIETDDQTDDSLRFMANVNRLLVRRGVRFDNSFASFPLCCPSRATLLTGEYAHNHGVRSNGPPAGGYTKLDHTNTLPVWLQGGGYYTALVGKYLNGYGSPETRLEVPPGWSEWHGATTLPYRGFTLNEDGQLHSFPATEANYQTDVLARIASDVIRRRASPTAPLFLWVSFFAPHSGGPVDPDDPSAGGAYLGPSPAARHRDAMAGQPLPKPPSFDEADVSDKPPFVRQRPRLAPGVVADVEEMYQQRLESLLAVDEGVARIVGALRARGQLSNTLIVFTSDNGFLHGEHRIPFGKTVAYEPSARVPLVVRGPDVPQGRRVQDLVTNVDLAPTILGAAGVQAGLELDGRSLLPLARDRLANYGRDILLESRTYSAIRTDRYKYVEHTAGPRELYDLQADPHELRSRHNDPSLARVRAELARRLAILRHCRGDVCRQGPRITFGVARAGGSVRLRLAGPDARWVSSVRFYARQRAIASGRGAPFTRLVDPRRLGTGDVATVLARVDTSDGRSVTLARSVRIR